MKSSELMALAEMGQIEENEKFVDQKGNVIFYFQNSFYALNTERFFKLIQQGRIVVFETTDIWKKYKEKPLS